MTPRETLTAEQLRERAASTEEQLMQGGAISAAGQGMARALAGPLPDYIATQTMTPEELSVLRRQEEKHQIAGMAGSLLGYVGGALTGAGVPGLLTKGAAAAGARFAAPVADIVGAGAGRAVGTIARHGLEGGGIALSEATGKGLVDRELGVPGVGSQIAASIGMGAGIGAAGGALLGVAMPRTANWLFQKAFKKRIAFVGDAMEKHADANRQYNAMKGFLSTVEGTMSPEELALSRGVIAGQGIGQYSRYIDMADSLESVNAALGSAMQRLKSIPKVGQVGPQFARETADAMQAAEHALRRAASAPYDAEVHMLRHATDPLSAKLREANATAAKLMEVEAGAPFSNIIKRLNGLADGAPATSEQAKAISVLISKERDRAVSAVEGRIRDLERMRSESMAKVTSSASRLKDIRNVRAADRAVAGMVEEDAAWRSTLREVAELQGQRGALRGGLDDLQGMDVPKLRGVAAGQVDPDVYAYQMAVGTPGAAPAAAKAIGGRDVTMYKPAKQELIELTKRAQAGDADASAILANFSRGADEFVPGLAQRRAALKSTDDKIRAGLEGTLSEIGDGAKKAMAVGVGDVVTLATAGVPKYILAKFFMPSIRGLGDVVFAGMRKTPMIRWALSNALKHGDLRGSFQRLAVVDGAYAPVATRYDPMIQAGGELFKAMKIPPIRAMTHKEFLAHREEMASDRSMAQSQALNLGLASRGVPPEVAREINAAHAQKIAYLQQHMPPVHEPTWPGDEPPPISASALLAYSRRARAALMPLSAVWDAMNGTLTPEAANAWWQTQPMMAEHISAFVRASVELAESHGSKLTSKQKEQLGLLIDQTGMTTARTKSKSLLQYMQGQRMQEEQQTPAPQPGGPPAPGSPKAAAGINQNSLGPSQELGNRLARR